MGAGWVWVWASKSHGTSLAPTSRFWERREGVTDNRGGREKSDRRERVCAAWDAWTGSHVKPKTDKCVCWITKACGRQALQLDGFTGTGRHGPHVLSPTASRPVQVTDRSSGGRRCCVVGIRSLNVSTPVLCTPPIMQYHPAIALRFVHGCAGRGCVAGDSEEMRHSSISTTRLDYGFIMMQASIRPPACQPRPSHPLPCSLPPLPRVGLAERMLEDAAWSIYNPPTVDDI